MGQAGFVLFALISIPLACTAIVVLYVRAARAEAAERFAILQRALMPIGLPALDLAPAFSPAVESERETMVTTGLTRVGPLPLAARVALLLGGDHGAAGMAAPMTTLLQRAKLIALVSRSSRRSGHALARVAGLRVELIELPAGAPCVVMDSTLLVRDCEDTEALVLSQASARLLADAGLLATEADAWLLASEMVAPAHLWETAAPSRRSHA